MVKLKVGLDDIASIWFNVSSTQICNVQVPGTQNWYKPKLENGLKELWRKFMRYFCPLWTHRLFNCLILNTFDFGLRSWLVPRKMIAKNSAIETRIGWFCIRILYGYYTQKYQERKTDADRRYRYSYDFLDFFQK